MSLFFFRNLIISLARINSSSRVSYSFLNLGFLSSFFSKESNLYDLYGIVHHSGSANGGHYISYTKNMISQDFYEFNDSRVSQIKNPEAIVNSGAYLLFYEKKI